MKTIRRRKDVFIDVDGTLLLKDSRGWSVLNVVLVEWMRKAIDDGFTLYLWSARGGDYAREVAERYKVDHMFKAILPKPSYVVDDMGFMWTKYIEIINVADINK